MRKPCTGARFRASRPAWMSHMPPATAPSSTATLAARLNMPWIAPQICVAGLWAKGWRLESWAAPTSISTTGSTKSPIGVRGWVIVNHSEPAASSHAASRYQSKGLESGSDGSVAARQARKSVWARSPAAAKPSIAMPRTPERKAGRSASQASATA